MIGLIAKRIFKFRNTTDLVMENLALRRQLSIMKRTTKRPQLHCKDRLCWVFLCRFWRHWREVLIIVKPDTVVRWHKQGFQLFWKRKSRYGGRSPIKKEIRDLVLKMANANPIRFGEHPYIDSIILSTFMLTGCREIHTTGRNHFSEIKNKGLSFVFY